MVVERGGRISVRDAPAKLFVGPEHSPRVPNTHVHAMSIQVQPKTPTEPELIGVGRICGIDVAGLIQSELIGRDTLTEEPHSLLDLDLLTSESQHLGCN